MPAAAVVAQGLQVESSDGSGVIHLAYTSPDALLAQPVLSEVIDRYYQKRLEIHRSTRGFAPVAQQTVAARKLARSTRDQLEKLRADPNCDEASIRELERQLAVNEEEANRLEAALRKAMTDQISHETRISLLQKPSQPKEVRDPRRIRTVLGMALGGPVVGLLLASLLGLAGRKCRRQ